MDRRGSVLRLRAGAPPPGCAVGGCPAGVSRQKAEKDGGSDPARSGGEPTGERPQKAMLGNSLLYSLGQGEAKAGEGNGSARPGPLHQGGIQPQAAQQNARRDIAHQDPGGGELGPVQKHLTYGA